jgi:hypothetical protein
MKFNIFLILIALYGCGQDYNSNTFDASKFEDSSIDNTTPFGQSYTILSSRCASCHTGYHNNYANYKTPASWISSGLVVAGNPAGSLVVSKLQNVGGTMPLGESAISNTEYQTIRNWISSL